MGINEGCSACHVAQTGAMKIAPEGRSESIFENKWANNVFYHGSPVREVGRIYVASEGLVLSSASPISILVHIRLGNLARQSLLFVLEPSTMPGSEGEMETRTGLHA